MTNKKIIYGMVGVAVLLILVVSSFYIKSAPFKQKQAQNDSAFQIDDNAFQIIAEADDMILMADTGLDIEWLVSSEDGRREIFERYRIVKKSVFEELTGNEVFFEALDISQDNAEVFLTYPDGTSKEIISNGSNIPFGILPSIPAGTYILNVYLISGKEYKFEFEFREPTRVELVATGETRIEENLQSIASEHSHEIELSAFSLGNLDLNEAFKVFHITPDNSGYGGSLKEARDAVYIDKYFWLDLDALETERAGHEQAKLDIAAQGEDLSVKDAKYLRQIERSTVYEHIFLVEISGAWQYAIANYPEDFK